MCLIVYRPHTDVTVEELKSLAVFSTENMITLADLKRGVLTVKHVLGCEPWLDHSSTLGFSIEVVRFVWNQVRRISALLGLARNRWTLDELSWH